MKTFNFVVEYQFTENELRRLFLESEFGRDLPPDVPIRFSQGDEGDIYLDIPPSTILRGYSDYHREFCLTQHSRNDEWFEFEEI